MAGIEHIDYRWQENGKGQWERNIDEVEQFYTTLAKVYEGSGRMFFAVTGFISFSIAVSHVETKEQTERRVEVALRKAWLRLRFVLPTLAASVEFRFEEQRCKKVYRAFDTKNIQESQENWIDDTLHFISPGVSGLEWCNFDPPAPSMPTLFVIEPPNGTTTMDTVTRDVVFRSPHDIIDGIGTLSVLNSFFEYASEAFEQGDNFVMPLPGSEISHLSPPVRVAAQIPDELTPDQEARVQDIIAQKKAIQQGVELLTAPFKGGTTMPGVHKRVASKLSREKTDQILFGCKKLGVSVTHVYHAALAIVLRNIQKQGSGSRTVRYISYSLINERPKCLSPYNTPQHAAALYHSVSGKSLAIDLPVDDVHRQPEQDAEEFARVVQEVRSFYEEIRDDPDSLCFVPYIFSAATPPYPSGNGKREPDTVPGPDSAASVTISSMGQIDKLIAHHHGPFSLENPWVTGEELRASIGAFLATFKGRLELSAAYNDAWHDGTDVVTFLEKCQALVMAHVAIT